MFHHVIKLVNKQDFETYKSEFQITIKNKITEAIKKFNETITLKLQSNKDEIIQSLKEWDFIFIVTEMCQYAWK